MKSLFLKNQKVNNGITLIALIITIIVLLILAGVTISLVVGDNGILNKAQQAKTDSVVAGEKEQIELAYTSVVSKKLENEVTDNELQDELDAIVGLNETQVTPNGDNTLNVLFKDTGHNYLVVDGKVTEVTVMSKITDENPGEFTGSGTESDPYQLSSIEDLVGLSNKVMAGEVFSGKYFELKSDLDFKSTNSYVDSSRTDFGDVNYDGQIDSLITELSTGQGFIPIGCYNGTNWSEFGGKIDGKNHTIYNLFQDNVIPNNKYTAGLIGNATNSVGVKNINLENVYINWSGNCGTAAIIGEIWDRSEGEEIIVENCNVSGSIINNGSVYPYRVGGILGSIGTGSSITIRNCQNHCDIYAKGGACAGIAGDLEADGKIIVENCINYGEQRTTSCDVGGICGILSSDYSDGKSEIKNCINYGNIIREDAKDFCAVGGIVADLFNEDFIISGCINYGDIIGNGNENTSGLNSLGQIGGIIGECSCYGTNLIIRNCINHGNINETAGTEVGGIAGYLEGTIENCYNMGNITGKENVGGIVGRNGYYNRATDRYAGLIKNSYNIGNVTGENYVGGISGINLVNAESTITNVFYLNSSASIGYTNNTDPITTNSDGMKTESQLKESEMITLLNTGNTETVWKRDTENTNNGYPIFNR